MPIASFTMVLPVGVPATAVFNSRLFAVDGVVCIGLGSVPVVAALAILVDAAGWRVRRTTTARVLLAIVVLIMFAVPVAARSVMAPLVIWLLLVAVPVLVLVFVLVVVVPRAVFVLLTVLIYAGVSQRKV